MEAGASSITDVSFSVSAGEVYCVLGGRGAGKSVLSRLLLGLLNADAGAVSVAGYEVAADPVGARRQIGVVDGRSALFDAMTVTQNAEILTRLGRPLVPWTSRDGRDSLRLMGVPERVFNQRVKQLPRDLVMSLWLAVAWSRKVPVLLLGDPTAGLDARAAARLQAQMAAFRDRRVAIVILTADLLFASQIADRIGILKRGRKVTEHTRAEVLSLSLTELYVDFVGQPPSRASLDALRAPTGR